jgi:hypothetical protein
VTILPTLETCRACGIAVVRKDCAARKFVTCLLALVAGDWRSGRCTTRRSDKDRALLPIQRPGILVNTSHGNMERYVSLRQFNLRAARVRAARIDAPGDVFRR